MSAAAAGLDITADTLNQDSYGTVIASGNVIIQQRPARIVRNLRVVPTGLNTVQADFDLDIEPATTAGKPEHRSLSMTNATSGWVITADQSADAGSEQVAVAVNITPDIESALESWSKAWSSQDISSYFAAYADNFKPDPRFANMAAWQAQRKRLITNKTLIRVSLQDIRIRSDSPATALAEFTQYYASDRTNSRDTKQLSFELTDSGWKITSESVIAAFTLATSTASRESPEQAVTAWKNAWNRRDLDAYVARYAPDAFDSGAFATRQAWLASLRIDFSAKPLRTMQADQVRFDRANHSIRADGHVRLQSAEGRIEATAAEIDSETHAGSIEQATAYLPGGERLQAGHLNRINDTTFEGEDARFTSCPEDEEAWIVKAKKVRLDQQAGELTASSASFEVAGLPVLYTPWWSQQLKRKSGLLTPRGASGKRRGTELGIPLYLAPAANWDATLTPTSMTARGIMGEAELRHISGLGGERIDVAGIRDKITGSTRSRLQSDIHWRLPADISLSIQADHVSDRLYLADYATGSTASQRYLQSTATLAQSYVSDSLSGNWMLMGQHQQDLTLASNAPTLQIQPRLQSHLQWQALENTYLHFDQQTTRFARRLGVDGWRMDLHPYVELPWQLAGGGLSATLQAGSHYTRYWLQNAAINTRQQRTTAEASLEVRSDFERISADNTWRHQISPLLRYDYVKAPDQVNMVNFDSAFGGLTWSNLLTGNRFSGYDRIERINRISAMLENRLQYKDGAASRDILLLRLGAAYDMLRKTVDPALKTAPARPFSNLLGEVTLTPVSGFSLFASGQYNPADKYWATLTTAMNIKAGILTVRAGYQHTDARYALAASLIDAAASLQLGQRWQANGDIQYDRLLKLTQQTTLGLKYTHPCWTLGLEGYRLNRPNGTAQASDFGVRILLEFKGLGSVGSS